jgi:hypothetical protein
VTSGSAVGSDGQPHGAGLVSEANSDLFQATLPAGSRRFSDPVALFNNIFWNNEAFTLSSHAVDATLNSSGPMDFEIRGLTGSPTFTPRYSLLSEPYGPAGQGNLVGQDPGFVAPFTLELAVVGSRLDPQVASVSITGFDPPVGLAGNYHLLPGATAIDRGVHCSNATVPAPLNPLIACSATAVAAPTGANADIDGQLRPQLRSFRLRTPWDLGADEVPTLP